MTKSSTAWMVQQLKKANLILLTAMSRLDKQKLRDSDERETLRKAQEGVLLVLQTFTDEAAD